MMTLVRNQPLAEEITQNTFYRAMTSKKTFAQRSGELTWLCSIAKHLAADEYRKTGKTAELDEAAAVSGGRDVCTPASKELVQRHLEHCAACRALYEELKDHSVDRVIETESRQVLERHARKERTAAWKAGLIISVLLLIPVILTFLFSIAVGGGLGVFSVTTASMLLVAALTAVPLMTEQKKLTKSILAGIFALLLILFFVDRMNGGGQFLLLAIPTIFGLSVPLFPFVIRGLALPPVLSDKKALLTMVWDTAWLFLTIFTVCHHSGDVEGLRAGTLISVILMSGVWLVFLTARYLPANRWIKAGLISLITGIWMAFSSDAYGLIAEHKRQLTILAAGILLGILCIAIGVTRGRK